MNSDKRHRVCCSEIPGGIIFSTASSLSICIYIFFQFFFNKKGKCKKNARVKYIICYLRLGLFGPASFYRIFVFLDKVVC